MKNFKKLSLLLIFMAMSAPAPAFADEAADKAAFKRLYEEFNELYTNSEDIDPVIEVGQKLYKLAPKAFGKNHMNTAVVTYNLAKLYDEIGNTWTEYTTGKRFYKLRAAEYYKKYWGCPR